jgi:MFS family permease
MTPDQRAVAIQGLFGLLGLVAAVVGGIIAHSESSSWALAIFVAFIAMYLGSRFLPEVLTEPQKGRRFLFFGIPPLLAVGALIGVYELWGEWWLAMLIGFALGLVGWGISKAAFPGIWTEEERQEKSLLQRLGGGRTPDAGSGGGSGSSGWPTNR